MGATTARRASRVPRVISGLLAAGLLLGVTMAFVDKPEQTLLVWAADQAHLAPDFVAVIDFDRRSPDLRQAPEYRAAVRHRTRSETSRIMSASRTTAGRWPWAGLLSVLRGQDQVFFFDVSDPRQPTFLRSNNPPQASITDELVPLSNGGFLVTFMGGPERLRSGTGRGV